MLVEVIVGKKTGDAALARALDFVRAIRKTPIVVNDSRGFYTSRVVETYIGEGHRMLTEGVPSAMIENAGVMAGMPVGPLSLNDEVGARPVAEDHERRPRRPRRRCRAGGAYRLVDEMVTKRGRLGRKNGKGFYDYPENPRGKKRLWPGLAELFRRPADPDTIDFAELKQRLLVIQALEAARCFAEGVITDVREADVGSILGFGFAPFTGGTLSYIDGMGAAAFVRLCAGSPGSMGLVSGRTGCSATWRRKGETFYGRFPPAAEFRHGPGLKIAWAAGLDGRRRGAMKTRYIFLSPVAGLRRHGGLGVLSHARIWSAIDRLAAAQRSDRFRAGAPRRARRDHVQQVQAHRQRWPPALAVDRKHRQGPGSDPHRHCRLPRPFRRVLRRSPPPRSAGAVARASPRPAPAASSTMPASRPGSGWDEIEFPGPARDSVFALEVTGEFDDAALSQRRHDRSSRATRPAARATASWSRPTTARSWPRSCSAGRRAPSNWPRSTPTIRTERSAFARWIGWRRIIWASQ